MGFWKTITRKEDPSVYQDKDSHLIRSLRVRDFLALGVGTIVSTSIFTLPGEVAASRCHLVCDRGRRCWPGCLRLC